MDSWHAPWPHLRTSWTLPSPPPPPPPPPPPSPRRGLRHAHPLHRCQAHVVPSPPTVAAPLLGPRCGPLVAAAATSSWSRVCHRHRVLVPRAHCHCHFFVVHITWHTLWLLRCCCPLVLRCNRLLRRAVGVLHVAGSASVCRTLVGTPVESDQLWCNRLEIKCLCNTTGVILILLRLRTS